MMSRLQKLRTVIFDKNMNLIIKSEPMFSTLFGNITTLTDFNTFLAKNTMLDENFLTQLEFNEKRYRVCYRTVDKVDTFEFHFFLLGCDWTVVDPIGRQDIYDHLTGLPTERSLLSLVNHELNRHSRDESIYTAIIIDIAHMQDINETFGFLSGDTIIKSVATTLRFITRSSDVIGRYKGDKFVIVLYRTDEAGAQSYLEKFKERLHETKFHFDDVFFHARFHVGMTNSVQNDSLELLIERLRNALAEDKQNNPISIKYLGHSED